MARAVIFMLALLLLQPAVAEPLERILWYNLESTAELLNDNAGVTRHSNEYGAVFRLQPRGRATFEVNSSEWWRLRVYYDDDLAAARHDPPTLWSSAGDGVFISQSVVDHQAEQGYTDYFYHQQSPSRRVVLLENSADVEVSVSLYQTQTRSLPDHAADAAIKLSAHHAATALVRQVGFESHEVQFIKAGKQYTTEFEQPGLYHLEIKIPWHASFRLSELLTLNVKSSQHARNRQLTLLAQLDSADVYRDALRRQTRWLSRSVLVPFYVAEPQQTIRLDLDQHAYLRWLASDSEQQFLMRRNAPRVVEQQRQRYFAEQPLAAVSRSFYRPLPPAELLHMESFVALQGELQSERDWFLPVPDRATREPDYFYQLVAGSTVDVQLPEQAESPPLRLSLKLPQQATRVTVRSDSGETVHVRYWPDVNMPEDWQLSAASRLATASATDQRRSLVSQTSLNFNQPYQSLKIENTGQHPAQFKLGYLVEQLRPPTQHTWFNRVAADNHDSLINVLMRGNQGRSQKDIIEREIAEQWHTRLVIRAKQFAERYPDIEDGSQATLDEAAFERIRGTLQTSFAQSLPDLEAVFRQIAGLGFNITARQLLTAFAAGDISPLQQQAESLLMQWLRQHDRWFDIEGYWAWRMLHKSDHSALAEIALSWTYQQRDAQAAQLYWLLEQAESLNYNPYAAMRAAWKSEQHLLFRHWLPSWSADDVVAAGWRKESPDFNGLTREAMIYNQALDQYLSTFYLQDSVPVTARVASASRFKVTLYPSVKGLSSETDPLKELAVTMNQKRYSFAVRLDRPSNSLLWSQNSQDTVVTPQSFIINAAQAATAFSLQTKGFDAGFVIESMAEGDHDAAEWPEGLTARLSHMVLLQQQQGLSDGRLKQLKYQLMGQLLSDQQQFLFSRLTDAYGWQRLDSVGASDGIAYLQRDHWQPESAWLKMRDALLLSEVKPGERRLTYARPSDVAVQLKQPARFRLKLRIADEVGRAQMPVRVQIKTPNGRKTVTVGQQPQSVVLELDAGRQVMELSLNEPNSGLVLYQLQNADNRSLLPESQIKTYRASKTRAIRLFVPGQSLLRVDKYQHRDDRAQHDHQWFEEDTVLTLNHEGQSDFSYYRFYLWQKQPQTESVESAQQQPAEPLAPVTPATVWPLRGTRSVSADTVFGLGEQEDGTWGFDLGYRVRNNFDEDTLAAQEHFIDTRWTYQHQLDSWQAYWDNSIHWREHNGNGLQTLVSYNRLSWLPNKYLDFEARVNLYYQAGADDPQVRGAWSAYGSLSARWQYFWNNRSRNDLELIGFARELSEQQVFAAAVDDDIVTQYKLDHRYGVTLRDRFYYKPWLDARAHVGAEVTVNELGQNSLFEKWAVESGWRQYAAPWRWGVDVKYTRYLADEDRRRTSSAAVIGVSLDYELWQQNGNLWEFGFNLRHDLQRNSTGLFLGLSWNHTDGQGYQDVAPRRRAFSSLRRQHALGIIQSNDVTEGFDEQ